MFKHPRPTAVLHIAVALFGLLTLFLDLQAGDLLLTIVSGLLMLTGIYDFLSFSSLSRVEDSLDKYSSCSGRITMAGVYAGFSGGACFFFLNANVSYRPLIGIAAAAVAFAAYQWFSHDKAVRDAQVA